MESPKVQKVSHWLSEFVFLTKKHHFFQAKVGETKAQGLSEEVPSEGEEGRPNSKC